MQLCSGGNVFNNGFSLSIGHWIWLVMQWDWGHSEPHEIGPTHDDPHNMEMLDPNYWPFVRGIDLWIMDSHHKGSAMRNFDVCFIVRYIYIGSPLYSEGSLVRRFFSPKPFEAVMVRRTYGPEVLYSEVPLLRKLLCSEDSIFRKALHYRDSMLRRFFSPKFI